MASKPNGSGQQHDHAKPDAESSTVDAERAQRVASTLRVLADGFTELGEYFGIHGGVGALEDISAEEEQKLEEVLDALDRIAVMCGGPGHIRRAIKEATPRATVR